MKPKEARWNHALITGGSSGIGRSLAFQLAALGTNLTLIARNKEQLEAVALEIKAKSEVDVQTISVDLSTESGLESAIGCLTDPSQRVDALFNNAGIGFAEDLRAASKQQVNDQLALNITALTRLTHEAVQSMSFLPNGGAIVNISSMAALQPLPGQAIYGASKAYVQSLSEALHVELKGSKVSVTAVIPGFVKTSFQEKAGLHKALTKVPSFMWLSSERVARETISGAANQRAVVIPGRIYKSMAMSTDMLPRSLKRMSGSSMNKVLLGVNEMVRCVLPIR